MLEISSGQAPFSHQACFSCASLAESGNSLISIPVEKMAMHVRRHRRRYASRLAGQAAWPTRGRTSHLSVPCGSTSAERIQTRGGRPPSRPTLYAWAPRRTFGAWLQEDGPRMSPFMMATVEPRDQAAAWLQITGFCTAHLFFEHEK